MWLIGGGRAGVAEANGLLGGMVVITNGLAFLAGAVTRLSKLTRLLLAPRKSAAFLALFFAPPAPIDCSELPPYPSPEPLPSSDKSLPWLPEGAVICRELNTSNSSSTVVTLLVAGHALLLLLRELLLVASHGSTADD